MSSAPGLAQRLADALFTSDELQRIRLQQASFAMLLMAISVCVLVYSARVAGTPTVFVVAWAALSLGAMLGMYAAIRSGWSRRYADPSLTLPQMIVALASGALAYPLAGPVRGATFPVLMVILMFGMFQLRPRTVSAVSLSALALFGIVMTAAALHDPAAFPARVEWGHFAMLAAMLPAVSVLAARLSRMRERSRRQRHELAQALARIQELATRDELTGLINRRHMMELLEQERQRCVRSGRVFSLALVDIDHFKRINDTLGHAAGDAVLRHFARQAQAALRVADIVARWGGDEFVLLLDDARAPLGRGGVERLRQRIATGAAVPTSGAPVAFTVSAGVAEHIAGESVVQTLERADRALYEAKAQGRDRTVLA